MTETRQRILRALGFQRRHPNGVIWVAAVLALVSSLIYGTVWNKAPILMDKGYLRAAQSFQAGEFDKPMLRTPGYPLLLWLCGLPPSKAIVWVGLLLHSVTTVLGVWLMGKAGLPIASGYVFAILMSLPLYSQSAGLLMTENLSEFTLVTTIVLWWNSLRRGSAGLGILAGVSAAFSAAVRPAYQLLPLVLSLSGGLWSLSAWKGPRANKKTRQWAVAAAPLAGLVILVLWSGWNLHRHGYFGLTYALGGNLCSRTILFIERSDPKWEPLRSSLIEARNERLIYGTSHTAGQYQWDHWAKLKRDTGLDDVQLSQRLAALNIELIASNPLEYLTAVAKAVVSSLFPYVTSLSGDQGIAQVVWNGLHFVVFGVWLLQLWVFGGSLIREKYAGWCRLRRGRPGASKGGNTLGAGPLFLYTSFGLIVAYTILVNAVFDAGEPRQRSPVDWFIVMQTIIGFEALARWCKQEMALGQNGRQAEEIEKRD